MKKRIVSLLLCVVLCFSLLPTAAFAENISAVDGAPVVTTPAEPLGSVDPNEPVDPIEPVDPVDPIDPTAPEDDTTAVDEAVAAVQTLIDALPTVETVTAADYDAVQEAYDAYDALSGEQQAQIIGAEAFKALFDWFNSRTATTTSTQQYCIVCGKAASENCEHDASKKLYFVVLEETDSLPSASGNYYLDHAVTLTDTWYPVSGTVLYLDSNAVIYGPDSKYTITVSGGNTFTLTGPDSNAGKITHKSGETGTGVSVVGEGSVFNMYGGTITGNTATHSSGDGHQNIYKGGGVYNEKSATFNMYGGTISGNNVTDTNGKIFLGGGVYNDATFTMSGGIITNNNATQGNGVYNENKATFIMTGGTITYNDSLLGNDDYPAVGGGVYNKNKATFTMSGGTIGYNNATNGGGVYNVGTLTMSGAAKLDSNEASVNGGGVYNASGASFTMSADASIIGNKGRSNMTDTNSKGGGVYNEGSLTLTGGTIRNNNAYDGGGVYTTKDLAINSGVTISGNTAQHGGGVYATADLTLGGGQITGNTAKGNGGGVYVKNAATMTGGTIDNNKAYVGGGVYVGSGAAFAMTAGTITKNEATLYTGLDPNYRRGGGVCVENGATFTLSDSAEISENQADGNGGGVYNAGNLTMTGGTISSNSGGWREVGNAANYDGGGGVYNTGTLTMSGGQIRENSLGQIASLYGYGGGVYNSGTFNMSGAAALDGNTGKSEYGNGYGGGVGNRGTFTMSGNAKIINSEAGTGGGVYALAGSFTMSGNAEISDNKAEGSGGGIYINDNAKFTINGGRITNNEAAGGNGGGIYNRSSGAVKLTGGEISGNRAYKYTYRDSWGWENEAGGQGGGVYNSFISTDRIPTFNMSGGIITGNTADRGGAGVYLYNEPYALNDQRGSRLIVSGNAQIIGNHLTDGTVNNVGLYKSENSKYASGMVTVNSATFCGSIGITSDNHVEGWQVLGGNAVSAVYGYFTSDVSGFSINSAGKLACGHTGEQVTQSADGTYSCTCGATGFVATVTRGTGESATVSYYQTVEAASSAAINGSTLTLLTDQAYGVELNGSAAYTLDIAGKKLNMGLTVSNGTVTIKNPSTEVKMRLTVTGGTVKISEGVFDTVNVTGGKVEISGGTFKKLTVSASGNAVLSGGSFESGVFNRKSGGKANDLLAEGYCYWKTTKDDSYAGTSSAVGATIVDLINRPTSLSVTASKSEVTYGYASDAVTLTAVLANEDGSVTYQWYLNDELQTGGSDTFTFPAGKDAGEYAIECKATAGGKTYTATVTIKVEKAALTRYAPSRETGMSYTGAVQDLVSNPSGLPAGCKVLYRQKDGTWKTDIPTGTDAGSYTIDWYIDGGTNHTDVGSSTSPNSLTAVIAPKTIDRPSVTRQEKVYDGTTAVTVTNVTFKDSNNEHVSLEPSDYTVSANFTDNANVGTGKPIKITVTLLNDNYTFKDDYGNNTKTKVLHPTGSISPITLSTTEPLKRYVNADQTYTYQLNELLSSLTGRADYGEITWGKPEFEYAADTDVDTTYYGNATIIGDNLTLHIKGNSTGRKTSTDGLIGTLTLTATAPTIQTSSGAGFKMQVKLYLSEKTLVVRPEGGLNPSAITYGQPLSKSEISTKPVKAGTTTEVEGSFAWVNPDKVPEAGTRWAEWIFTPTDKDTYESVNGAAAVTVNKATPTIKYGANELGEDNLLNKTYDTEAVTFSATHQVWDGTAYNEKTVGGTWSWEKVTGEGESKTYTPAAAPVNVAGSGTYRVTFTPNDTTNYEKVTFNVTVTISPKALTFSSASADNRAYKPYNGYVTLTLGELDGICTADQGKVMYSLDYASIGQFDEKGREKEYQMGNGQPVTVDGIRLIGEAAGNYTPTQPTGLTVDITPRNINAEGIKVTLPDDLAYTGGVPTVTIEDIYDKVLVAGTDYTISGAVTTVGTHTLTITGMGNYEGTRTVNYSIEKKEITRDMVTISSRTYNGNSQSPTVTVTNGATELTKGTDYTVTVTPQTDAGSYRLNVVAVEGSNYTGGVTCYWSISPQVLQVERATVQDKSYDGTATATVESVTFKVGDSDVSLAESDYTASAEFADAEVGEGKDVTVTVTLLNPNYCFMETADGETQETTVATLMATAGIVRATWSGQRPTAKEDPLRVTQDQTLLSGDVNLLANLPDNSDIAGIRVGSFSLGTLPARVSASVDADGKLSFTITGGKAGDSFTIPVTFTCENYLVGEETPLTISFNVVVELTGAGHEPIRRQPIFTGAAGGNGGAAGGTTGGAEVTSPATGDAGIAVYALLSLCAALGTGVTVGRKKRKH